MASKILLTRRIVSDWQYAYPFLFKSPTQLAVISSTIRRGNKAGICFATRARQAPP